MRDFRMKTMALLLIIALTLSIVSCAQSSNSTLTRRIEAAHIQNGVTTEQDLIAQLGEPQVSGFDFKRRKMLIWNLIDVRSTNKLSMTMLGRFLPEVETVEEPELKVSFDAGGRVAAWRLTTASHSYR